MAAVRTRWAAVTGAAALAATACAGTASVPREPAPATAPAPAAQAPAPPGSQATSSSADFDATYRARLDSARTRYTPADVHFMTGMIGHHAQALVMSGMAPSHGANASVRTLAARIINSQQDEIASMQRWLRERGQPVPEVHIEGTMVMLHGVDHDMSMPMPGMLTPEQMQELDRARGPEFDRLFLKYMIQHHRGAVTMVQELFATDGAGQDEAVFKFASDAQVDQSTEIARMERMLAALPASGGAP